MKKRIQQSKNSTRKSIKKPNKKAQIWVETVMYTLIAFVMIGLVLAYAKPKIEEIQDKALIEQSIGMIKDIDSTILTIGPAGNQRVLELGIKKGSLTIDSENEIIYFEMDSKYTYSEPGLNISDGNLIINTEKKGNANIVTLTRNYLYDYNITYQEKDVLKTITKSSTPYKLFIINKGGEVTNIDIEIN